ncbi:MAG: aminotransferase class III-fold pyridoxal phosphate-dependent enzyme [Candidatus Brocadiae bacterium]|nr:aminotransferase class III-fold pyridoxal phosphate-dependent enzyme [Candidatus Brocadiia bacterium]
MTILTKLQEIRDHSGPRRTRGVPDDALAAFAGTDSSLVQAVDHALSLHRQLRQDQPALLAMAEAELVVHVQQGLVNFYKPETVNPYVALAAKGPWIVTTHGGVVHDNGGYGMLGAGHAPQFVIDAMARPQVMANIMTPSLSHLRLTQALRREIGHTRGGCPYTHFLCLNSGSESVTLAGRLADVHTKLMTDPGAPHAGRKVKRISVKGSFHGRTELPALYSDSSRKTYAAHLGSYQHHAAQAITIDPYSIEQLEQAFADAEREGWHIEAMFLEPVMGEGDPGRAADEQGSRSPHPRDQDPSRPARGRRAGVPGRQTEGQADRPPPGQRGDQDDEGGGRTDRGQDQARSERLPDHLQGVLHPAVQGAVSGTALRPADARHEHVQAGA